MPFGPGTHQRNLAGCLSGNQGSPFLVSSKGRYIWNDKPFEFEFGDGELRVRGEHSDFLVKEGFANLREAFLNAVKSFFPPSGRLPHPLLFTKPQYNTWIELQYGQEQGRIVEYAEAVLKNGFPAGVLMIDDTWQDDYGNWEFHAQRFPDPKGTMAHLHDLGFEVMLWLCPFVSPDSFNFRFLRDHGLLIRGADGEVAIRKWWNGYSGMLDVTNPQAVQWLRERLQTLTCEYGIDGFKFDAGDPDFYRDDDISTQLVNANEQAEAWARIGVDYSLNEYRACWKGAGLPLVQRLSDKSHSWGENGLASLVPNGLAQGLLGYAFTCPDMIGGGQQTDFVDPEATIDQELFVRSAQCSALFPMMQFSAAPWRVLDSGHTGLCREAVRLHERIAPEIEALACHAAATGEPIIRPMAYEFPGLGLERVIDQFMLGRGILVAPVVEKGATSRLIRFPPGKWRGDDGSLVEGSANIAVNAPLSRLPWYRRE